MGGRVVKVVTEREVKVEEGGRVERRVERGRVGDVERSWTRTFEDFEHVKVAWILGRRSEEFRDFFRRDL